MLLFHQSFIKEQKAHTICKIWIGNSKWSELKRNSIHHRRRCWKMKMARWLAGWWPVWPDWAINCTLVNFSKPVATIILPKLLTFFGNFCKGILIFHVSSEIIFGDFLRVTLLVTSFDETFFGNRCLHFRSNFYSHSPRAYMIIRSIHRRPMWCIHPSMHTI